jgi:hypothetical protein
LIRRRYLSSFEAATTKTNVVNKTRKKKRAANASMSEVDLKSTSEATITASTRPTKKLRPSLVTPVADTHALTTRAPTVAPVPVAALDSSTTPKACVAALSLSADQSSQWEQRIESTVQAVVQRLEDRITDRLIALEHAMRRRADGLCAQLGFVHADIK